MKIKTTILAFGVIILLCAGWFIYLGFTPRTYPVIHLKTRNNTKYWQLPGGARIAYWHLLSSSPTKRSPVIYLHGGPGAGITDLEIKTLSQLNLYGYDVYLYDQVGCGHSSRLKNISDYTAQRHLADLQQIVQQIHADKVILIGQSWGAILSSMFVAANPEKVEKLVITAPAALQPANPSYADAAAPDGLQLRAPNYETHADVRSLRSRLMEFWLRTFNAKLASDEEADEYATYITNYLNKTMVCDSSNAVQATGTEGYYVHYMTRLSLGKIPDPRPALKNFASPVLIMKAQCDNQRWGYTQEYLDVFTNEDFRLIRNAGHNIFIERGDEYVNVIREFLNEQ